MGTPLPPALEASALATRTPGTRTTITSTSSLELIENLFAPEDQPLFSTSTNAQFDFNSLFSMSPADCGSDMPEPSSFNTSRIFPMGIEDSRSSASNNSSETYLEAFTSFNDTGSELFTVATAEPQVFLPRIDLAQNRRDVYLGTEDPPFHSCLVQALRSMEQVSLMPNCSTKGETAIHMPTTQAVIAQNAAVIEAVTTMLGCTCSQDDYLLAVIPLVLFKVLSRYAVVVRRQTPSSEVNEESWQCADAASREGPTRAFHHETPSDHAVGSSCGCSDEVVDSNRMAAQLVLGELYLVRRAVEQLSRKLQDRAISKKSKTEISADREIDLGEEISALQFSTGLYDHVSAALAKRLKALLLDIISRLKRL